VRELVAEASRLEEVAEREAVGVRRVEQRRRLAVEADDFLQQTQVRRPEQIAPLREEPARAAAAVLEAGAAA